MPREQGGEAPVERLRRESSRRDDDGRPPARSVAGLPDVARQGRAVAGGEQHRPHGAAAVRRPVVEAHVARALERTVRAEVLGEVPLGVGGGDQRVVDRIARVLLGHQRLELRLRRQMHLAFVDLREVDRLGHRIERARRRRGRERCDHGHQDERPSHPLTLRTRGLPFAQPFQLRVLMSRSPV